MTTNASTSPTYRRKLIEVDLPLDEINAESISEKITSRPGHPSTLHQWWAPRPLVACRAVIFASMVDDPMDCEEFKTKEAQDTERERLHNLIRRLVKWENSSDENLIAEARYEIARSVARSNNETAPTEPAEVLQYLNDKALPIYDPFAGGGSIPLEAQRLGLRAVASDLNPVAVLINKALIELPPKFAGQPPVNPKADPMGMFTGKFTGRGKNRKPVQVPWRGAAGLANDIRYYGKWMREEAFKRIGHLYPKAKLPGGGEATVIAWLWARTVPCPNPACGVQMPMMKTFQLSKKANNQHWTKPLVDGGEKSISFVVQDHSKGVPNGATVNRNSVTCIACQTSAPLSYVREQSTAGYIGEQMIGIVAEGDRKRLFVSPIDEQVRIASNVRASKRPTQAMPEVDQSLRVRGYGITHWHELFTERQLTALTTFSDLIPSVHSEVIAQGATKEYANAVCTYLALAIGKFTNMCSSYTRWRNSHVQIAGVIGRQAIPMIWDFAEGNPFSASVGNWKVHSEWIAKVIEQLPVNTNDGRVHQADASTTIHADEGPVIVTDPPYYDNISYAELSDFFYVWLRPVLRDIYPDLFAGILVPIQEEMIAAPRFENARERFEKLMNKTLNLIRERCSPEFPSSIFYAYKQQEEQRKGIGSTGWETMLTALADAGFQIIGTWPMRTEGAVRFNALGVNALASSVILVCRPRAEDAPVALRRQFMNELEHELPPALDHLTHEGHIAPVDLRQAAIGPGMKVYSRYAGVQTPAGEPVSVRDALIAINNIVAKYFDEAQGEMDAPTRLCYQWLQEHGFASGPFGEAETLSQGLNTGLNAVAEQDRIITSRRGLVQLVPIDEYGKERSNRMSERPVAAWEGAFRMAYHMQQGDEYDGEEGAARVLNEMLDRRVPVDSDAIERLARILYNHFDGKDTRHAVIFNRLVVSWQSITGKAQELRESVERQLAL